MHPTSPKTLLLFILLSGIGPLLYSQTPPEHLPQTDTLSFPTLEMPQPESGTDNDTLIPLVPGERPPAPRPVPAADTAKLPRSAIPWFSEEQLQNPFTSQPSYADTTLLNFQHYDFAARSGWFYAQKGNPGHAHRQLVFNPALQPGLITGENEIYGHNIFRHSDLQFFRPKHVFTDLFYIMGAEREQLFYAKHAQKLSEELHFSFQYRVINSPGAFSRLGARNTNFYGTIDYLSENKRYQVLGSVIANRVRNMESGGLKDRLLFEEDADSDSVLVYRAESRYSDFSINLRHFYQTGVYVGGDTLQKGRFINLGRINHDFTYSRKAFVFEEKGTPVAWYNMPMLDPETGFDSTTVHRIENRVSWSNFPLESPRRTFPFNFKVYLSHSIHTVEQPWLPDGAPLEDTTGQRIFYYDRSRYNQIVQGVELRSDQRRMISFGGFANLTVGGYNDEDVHAGAFVNLGALDKPYQLEGMLRYSSMEAPYFFNTFSSNYARWENDFRKMQIINFRARLTSPWIKIEGNYYQLENMVYMNRMALPVQMGAGFGLFSLGLHSDLEFDWLGLRNHVVMQHTTTRQYERFPNLVSYHSLYFHFPLSDGAMYNHIGVDFHYNPGYRAMAWMPVSRVFHDPQSYILRDRYLVDVFWNAKIKSARLFIKYQNILGLLPDFKPRYEIPFYPIPESMFKFGVSWMFFD